MGEKKVAKKIAKKPKADVVVKREDYDEISTKGIKRTKHTEALAPFPVKAAEALGVEVPELIDDDAPTGIVSTIRLDKIELKDMRWLCKLRIGTLLPRSYHLYKILMELDEQPYTERIEDLEAQVKGSLFENEKSTVKSLDEMIARVRKELTERRKECETMKFNCSVEELKYSGSDTILIVRVPDDTIEAFNRQKTRLSYYKITLESL